MTSKPNRDGSDRAILSLKRDGTRIECEAAREDSLFRLAQIRARPIAATLNLF